MKIGTKSVLFGAHQFIIHPLLLVIGWWQEYGFEQVPIGEKDIWVGTTLREPRSSAWGSSRTRDSEPRLSEPALHQPRTELWVVLEPWWLYLPRVWATGELEEFMAVARRRSQELYEGDPLTPDERLGFGAGSPRMWNRTVRAYMSRWLDEHRGGKPDSWTRNRTAA